MAAHQSVFSVMALFLLRFRGSGFKGSGFRVEGFRVQGVSPAAGLKSLSALGGFCSSIFDILRFAVQSRLGHGSARFDRNRNIDLQSLIRIFGYSAEWKNLIGVG